MVKINVTIFINIASFLHDHTENVATIRTAIVPASNARLPRAMVKIMKEMISSNMIIRQ